MRKLELWFGSNGPSSVVVEDAEDNGAIVHELKMTRKKIARTTNCVERIGQRGGQIFKDDEDEEGVDGIEERRWLLLILFAAIIKFV